MPSHTSNSRGFDCHLGTDGREPIDVSFSLWPSGFEFHSSTSYPMSVFYILVILMGVECYLIRLFCFICVSFKTIDIEQIFMCSFVTFMSFLMIYLLKSVAPFYLVIFLELDSVLSSFWIQALYLVYILQIFYPILWFVFHSLKMFFEE